LDFLGYRERLSVFRWHYPGAVLTRVDLGKFRAEEKY
jgi:hypothetical protein